MDTPAKKVHEDYGHTHLKMMHRQDAFSRNKITKVSEKKHMDKASSRIQD